MLAGFKTDELNTILQDRVQKHYGNIVRAGVAPVLATTDIAQGGKGALDANPSWEQALSQAMERSTTLMAAQADLAAREAEIARREAQLNQREKELQNERRRTQMEILFGTLRQA
ncbi:hypothetical protein [Chitinimonas sp.]|uniref:hypothetical protein n=1 Tax=Chitinimonas sp. TaxID=1934313 RepID=UPI0035B17025